MPHSETGVKGFNPHPTFRPDATSRSCRPRWPAGSFNPHPTFRPDATRGRRCRSPAPWVSTLIRPSGRMQRAPAWIGDPGTEFQPSSDLQAGCNHLRSCHHCPASKMFQPSSDLQAGCNGAAVKAWSAPPPSFNPHPTFRPDATSAGAFGSAMAMMFQPSSDLQAGCNGPGYPLSLTDGKFQPSSDLQAGCNRQGLNPGHSWEEIMFQPSSDLQAGCNAILRQPGTT